MNCVKCGVTADCTDGSGQWWCKSDFPYVKQEKGHKEKEDLPVWLQCNMHGDETSCLGAEKTAGKKLAHCYDEFCEDCFGK